MIIFFFFFRSLLTPVCVFLKIGKPEIIEEPRDVEVNFGGTVSFHCKVDGDPEPDVVWYRNR